MRVENRVEPSFALVCVTLDVVSVVPEFEVVILREFLSARVCERAFYNGDNIERRNHSSSTQPHPMAILHKQHIDKRRL